LSKTSEKTGIVIFNTQKMQICSQKTYSPGLYRVGNRLGAGPRIRTGQYPGVFLHATCERKLNTSVFILSFATNFYGLARADREPIAAD
jgi:hypothetical protein